MVRQLVLNPHVPAAKIVVYDARRDIYPGLLKKVWGEFKDVSLCRPMPPIPNSPTIPVTAIFTVWNRRNGWMA